MSTTINPDEWQGRTGQSWAAEWRRTDRSFGALTERLLQRSREFPFDSVLDIGCGAGELSLAIARGRPHCRVIGVDISPQLIGVARQRGQRANVSFEVDDVATWLPPEGFAPQLLVSRHGVMFFADPTGAFAHLRTIASPGAGLMFSCFRAWEDNPIFTDVSRLLPDPPPPPVSDQPGPFAFADAKHVETVLAKAGWTHVAFEPFDFPMIVGAGEDPVEDAVAYFAVIGPAARAARELPEEARERFFDRLRKLMASHLREGIVSQRAAAWIVTARA
jgi:SAM-dependent methyltransferase